MEKSLHPILDVYTEYQIPYTQISVLTSSSKYSTPTVECLHRAKNFEKILYTQVWVLMTLSGNFSTPYIGCLNRIKIILHPMFGVDTCLKFFYTLYVG